MIQMYDKKVSVIICVYNGEKYIKECIKSIEQQTYKNMEIILIDDGSTDNTNEIVKECSHIRYIYQKNMGLAGARNTALKYVTGEYITMLDVDDLYMADKISKQVEYLEKNKEIDIVYNDVELIDQDGKFIKILKSDYGQLEHSYFLANLFFRQIIHCTASMMFRKKCFSKLRYAEDIKQSEDYYITIQLAKEFKFGYLAEVLYKYRRHNANLTNNRSIQQENEIKIIRDIGKNEIKSYIENTKISNQEKLLLYGKILYKMREYKESVNIFNQLEETEEIMFYKYFYIGNAYYMIKNYDEAKNAYVKILMYNNRAEIYNNLGVIFWHESKAVMAKEYFNRAIKIRKEYIDPVENLELIENNNNPNITNRELRENLMRY